MINRFIELQIDDHTIACGTVIEEDESFDHAFGFKGQFVLVVKDFYIITYIEGIDYDITNSLKPNQIDYFKQKIIDNFIENQGSL